MPVLSIGWRVATGLFAASKGMPGWSQGAFGHCQGEWPPVGKVFSPLRSGVVAGWEGRFAPCHRAGYWSAVERVPIARGNAAGSEEVASRRSGQKMQSISENLQSRNAINPVVFSPKQKK